MWWGGRGGGSSLLWGVWVSVMVAGLRLALKGGLILVDEGYKVVCVAGELWLMPGDRVEAGEVVEVGGGEENGGRLRANGV